MFLQRYAGNRAVVAQLQPSPEPNATPRPSGPRASQAPLTVNAIPHEGQFIATGVDGCRQALERVSAEKGAGEARRWAARFLTMEVLQRASLEAVHGKELVDGTMTALRTADEQFERANTEFLMTFETRAGNLVDELLIRSEDQIKAEQRRLGLDRLAQGGDPDTGAMERMRAAAAGLLDRRRQADALLRTSAAAQEELGRSGPAGQFGLRPELQERAESARAASADAEREYGQLATRETAEQPVLALYTTGGNAAAKLSEILSMTQGGSRLGFYKVKVELDQKLANIKEVHDSLGGRFNIWNQRTVVEMTKRSLAASPHQSRLVDDRRHQLSTDEEDSRRVWAILAIGFGLLAVIPSGGSSLLVAAAAAGAIGGAAIAAYQTYEEVQKASLQSAAAGTALDKANAISQDEPDYLWLAVDVVSAIVDVVAAGAAFTTLRTLMSSAHLKDVESLRKLALQCEAARLSPTSRGRVFASALHGAGSDVAVTLEQMLQVFRKIKAPASEQRIVNYAHQMAEHWIAEGKLFSVRPGLEVEDATRWFMKTEGMSEGLARETAKEVVTGAMQDGAFFRYDGKEAMFLRGAGTPESVASVFVHELTHLKQARMGIFNTLSDFEAEVSAFASERDFLNLLPKEAVPANYMWLREASDGQIYLHVCEEYRIPATIAARPSDTYLMLLEELRAAKRR
jgi:hypothetical protein